jgi:hypothetical protein
MPAQTKAIKLANNKPAVQNGMTMGIQNGFSGTDDRKFLSLQKSAEILREKPVPGTTVEYRDVAVQIYV